MNNTLRSRLKSLTHLIPDKPYLCIRYRLRTRKKLRLKNPQTFNEKMQWLKLYDRNPKYTMLVDKFAVRKYITKILGDEFLIPLLGVWKDYDDIDFDDLPDQFVLKCSHDSGGLIVCRDKRSLDRAACRKKITNCLSRNYFWGEREWPYKNVPHRIIAEKYMEEPGRKSLRDYKFFCFNGDPKFIYISEGLENHKTAAISFFDFEGNRMPFHRGDYKEFETDVELPMSFPEMLQIARKCAKEISVDFIRVDLYEINHRIYFSEFTFTPCGGFIPFEPKEWDEKVGQYLKLSQ